MFNEIEAWSGFGAQKTNDGAKLMGRFIIKISNNSFKSSLVSDNFSLSAFIKASKIRNKDLFKVMNVQHKDNTYH